MIPIHAVLLRLAICINFENYCLVEKKDNVKTRVLYPKNIWFDRHFKALTAECKNLCLYLVSNENIGLTRMYEQHDAEICYVLGISESRLAELKDKIQETGLFLFKDEWIYINNDFSYVDYEGRDRVLDAKNKELTSIPKEVINYFKGVIKGLKTGYKPPINHKSKIINHKSEYRGIVKGDETYTEIINHFNQTFEKQTKSYASWKDNCDFWLKTYTLEDIKKALTNCKKYGWWAKDPTLDLLFRTKNKNGQPVDYIDQLLNSKEALKANRPVDALTQATRKALGYE